MSEHANDFTIGEVTNNRVTVKVRGPLAAYINGVKRYVVGAAGVTSAMVVDGEAIVVADCQLISEIDTAEQIQVRVRNRCRDYIHAVTGFMSDIGPESNYTHLTRSAQLTSA